MSALVLHPFLTLCFSVIMATNRADTLDPALLRPGRLDRKIEFPVPDRRQKRLIFQVVTSKMNLHQVLLVVHLIGEVEDRMVVLYLLLTKQTTKVNQDKLMALVEVVPMIILVLITLLELENQVLFMLRSTHNG